MRGLMDHLSAARDHVELALELDQIGAHPAIERGEPLGKRRRTALRADMREAIEDRDGGGSELAHGLSLRCSKFVQRFLKDLCLESGSLPSGFAI